MRTFLMRQIVVKHLTADAICCQRIECERSAQSRTGLCGPLRMWALAPSQADVRADRGGVPSRSVIRSS